MQYMRMVLISSKKTKIYCGHEYTKKNIDFCLKYENNNS